MANRIDLEQQRKRAKDLRRAIAGGDAAAAERVVRHLPRARSVAEVLARGVSLSDAQLVVAREAGFASWPAMKHALDERAVAPRVNLIEAALAGDDAAVAAALAHDPGATRRSLAVAAAVADAAAALDLIAADKSASDRRDGERGWTPLLLLCCSRYRRGDAGTNAARLSIARALLAAGADPNARGVEPGYSTANVTVFDEHEWTPIEGAVGRVVSAPLLAVLLAAGARPDQTGSSWGAFLARAVEGGDPDVLRAALAADPPSWQVTWALLACVERDRHEMAAMLAGRVTDARELAPAIAAGIRRGSDAAMLDVLFGDGSARGSRPVWETAYRLAHRHGHAPAVVLLRQRGIDDSALAPVDQLIAAAVAGDRGEVERLAFARAALRRDDHRHLAWAIRTRPEAAPRLLAAGLDPNVPDKDGEAPLHLAVRAGAPELVAQLIAAGARVEARNFDGKSALELALGLRDPTAITEALHAAGASPTAAPDRPDMDRLFERAADAVAFGDLEGLRALLDEEPALVHARSPRPHRATLLNYCGANGTESPRQRTPANAPAIAALLLARGADPNAECKLYGGGADTMGLLLTSGFPKDAGLDGEIVKVLVRGGADLRIGDDEGPMPTAIAYGLLRSVQALAGAGVPVDNLLVAAALDRVDVLAALLDGGADVNQRFSRGITALHAAAQMGHERAVRLLLARGADPTLVERRWGGTAAENARHVHFDAIAAIIDRHRRD